MIELAFVVCLNSLPTSCDDRALQFVDVSVTGCIMGAQPQLAQWVNEHPGWQIQRWSCRPVGSDVEL